MTDTSRTHANWIGRTVFDRSGEKIGSIADVYYDDQTGRPEWMTVSTGWLGSKTQFVPIAGTSTQGDDIVVEYDKDLIKEAPSVDVDDAHLDEDEERRLYRHYGFDAEGDAEATYGDRNRADEGFDYYDWRETGRETGTQARTQATDRDTASTTRSEEELSIDKTERTAGRARLHKYVVTEDVNVTVPVKKQVARLVREPVSGETGSITDVGDTDEEIVLTEEQVNVDKRTVAKERVGIEVDEVTEQRTVNETLQKERVEVEGDVDQTRR
jgi:uncharacterized protein (TIGR02271 family)